MAKREWPVEGQRDPPPMTCVDYWPASPRVFMSARRWVLYERVMWSSPELFTTREAAQADTDHFNKGTMGSPFMVEALTLRERT